MGGIVLIGFDNNIYVTIGDLDGNFKLNFQTTAQNYKNGTVPDGRRRVIRISPDGMPVSAGVLGSIFPANIYYAYGIRNSFG